MPKRRLVYCRLALIVSFLLPSALHAADTDAGHEFFEKQVRPILVARCYECHQADATGKKEPKGNLRVDSREALLKGGDTSPAIVPGEPQKSLLIDAINYGDTYQMPPKSRMPPTEVAVLTKWIEMGAPWPKDPNAPAADDPKKLDLQARKQAHWAWKSLQSPAIPQVNDPAWGKQTLDRFILAKIEAAGMTHAAPADKRTLLRRLSFDLIGLPPTTEEVREYLLDESPQATEKVVDRLLTSPHFGERWARHWLDLVRYAESRGHEFDPNAPNAYQYRDYVIRAFNADVPYDQFVTEHIAGDLLPAPRRHPTEGFNESIIGTGFWFLGEWVHSPVDIRKDESDRFDNMVDVFSKTFLGMTVACARCHDHKFDAVLQSDFYALSGYLQSSGYRLARFDTQLQHQEIARELAALNRDHAAAVARATGAKLQAGLANLPALLSAAREAIQGAQAAGGLFKDKEEKTFSEGLSKSIENVATTRQVAPDLLKRWVETILKARKSPDDLLHPWALVCASPADQTQRVWSDFAAKQKPPRDPADALGKATVIVDYAHPKAGDWLVDGVLFGDQPRQAGELIFTGGKEPLAGVALFSSARRDPTWNGLTLSGNTENDPNGLGRVVRAGKTIRTPTFKLDQPNVQYLIRGAGFAYAAVDSHAMIAGPLHGGIVQELGNDGDAPLRWVNHHLGPYVGHRFHIELSAKDDLPFEVLMIVQGNPAGLPVVTPTAAFANRVREQNAEDAAKLIQGQQSVFTAAAEALQTNQLAAEATPAEIRFAADWLVRNSDLLPVNAEAASAFSTAVQDYVSKRDAITSKIRRDSRLAMAMWDGSGEDEQLMIRGNSKLLGPTVPRRLLVALEDDLSAAGFTSGPLSPESGSGRLDLARKLLHPANPFTSRVMVNRAWHLLFGRGLVPTTDNFGVLGLPPTHPELLDYLALEFQRDGWSVKRLLRRLVLSNTYQQASTPADAKTEDADPQNLLWRRADVRRLQGEAIRDSMLAISGRLDPKLFGQQTPVHLTEFMQGRGRPGSGPLDGAGRRSIYLSVRRNFLSPMMLTFDTPIPFSTVGRRNVSNVPAQALILMNDPFVLEQAKLWAKRMLAAGAKSPEERIAVLYEQAFQRPPSTAEIAESTAFLRQQAEELKLPPERMFEDERVWGDLCHVLWNVKEFVFVN